MGAAGRQPRAVIAPKIDPTADMTTTINWRMVRAVILLPGNALVIIPLIILWAATATAYTHRFSVPTEFSFWIAVILILVGLTLGIATSRLFLKFGEGTPAPWDPPKKLVIRGPYRYVRNPMISSVLISLTAEAIYFQSWPLLVWMGTFLLVNVIYFPLVEEKGLVARFGEDYKLYQANVPRWLPRLTPWSGHR